MASSPALLAPIPERLVVLTFDDGCRSHFEQVRPLLRAHGFSATFFVTEGLGFADDKAAYMTWQEVAQLHAEGFEIGNHTRRHLVIDASNVAEIGPEIDGGERAITTAGIARPTSFAFAGRAFADARVIAALEARGYRFARRGGYPEHDAASGVGVTYDPTRDHRLFIPSVAVPRAGWTAARLMEAIAQAPDGQVPVLTFHGVPDIAHPELSVPFEVLSELVASLARHDYQVIALRDLQRFVNPRWAPADFRDVLRSRGVPDPPSLWQRWLKRL